MPDTKRKPEPAVLFYLRGRVADVPPHNLTAKEAEDAGGVEALLKITPPVYSLEPPAAYYRGGTTGAYHAGVPLGNLTAAEVKAVGGWDFLLTGDPPLYSPDPPAHAYKAPADEPPAAVVVVVEPPPEPAAPALAAPPKEK